MRQGGEGGYVQAIHPPPPSPPPAVCPLGTFGRWELSHLRGWECYPLASLPGWVILPDTGQRATTLAFVGTLESQRMRSRAGAASAKVAMVLSPCLRGQTWSGTPPTLNLEHTSFTEQDTLFAARSLSFSKSINQLTNQSIVAEAVKRQACLDCSIRLSPRTCQCNLVSHLSLAHNLYSVSIPGESLAGTRPPFQMSRDLLTAKQGLAPRRLETHLALPPWAL